MGLFRWESAKEPEPYYTFTGPEFTDRVLEGFLKYRGAQCNGALAAQLQIDLRAIEGEWGWTDPEVRAFHALLLVGTAPMAPVWRDARETLRARECARIQLAMDREVK